MSSYITLIVFAVVIIGLLSFSARAKRRAAEAQSARAEQIDVGTEVMTTSGLYGTVAAKRDDDSVVLSIAPGVEVRWALAALRPVQELPPEFRGAPVAEEEDDWSDVGVRIDKPSLDKSPDPDAGPERPSTGGAAPA